MSEDNNMKNMGVDPIGKLLLRYSLPAITGMIVFSLYNIVDSIFIGHGVGPMALSGLSIAFPIMNLVFALGLLLGIGGAAVSSIRIGQKNIEGAHRVLGNVLILTIIAGVLFGGILLYFLDDLLVKFGASPQTHPYARDFISIILLGLPITYVTFNLNHIMRATGYPKKAMLSAIMTVGVNIILAPIFIFWLEWGIKGAAFATVLAQLAGMAWVLHHFLDSNSLIHFQKGIFKLRKNIIKSILAIGMSPCLMNVSACVVVVIINTGLMKYGGDMAVGAYGIINRILILFGMIVVGLTQGMQPIVGYNYGAKNMGRVKETLKLCIITGAAITTFGFLTAELLPRTIAGMFTDDKELTDFAVRGLRLCVLAFVLVGAQIVIGNFFQAIGKAKISIILSLTRQVLFLIPCLLLFPLWWGQDGIWISMPVADCLSFVVSLIALSMFLKKLKFPFWEQSAASDPVPALSQEHHN